MLNAVKIIAAAAVIIIVISIHFLIIDFKEKGGRRERYKHQ